MNGSPITHIALQLLSAKTSTEVKFRVEISKLLRELASSEVCNLRS